MAELPAASGFELRSRRFRLDREGEWRRLETLLDRLEKGSLSRLSDEELASLPGLYRSTLSSLATARAISLDQALQAYLEGLCTRAYFVVYGVRARPLEQVGRFFAYGWPSAVRDLWRETLAAAAILALGWVAAYLLVRAEPDWFSALMPGGMAEGRTPDADPAALRHALYGEGKSGLAIFSSFLFTHNAQTALFAFALGFAFCVPTAMLVLTNGAGGGALTAVYVKAGLGWQLGGWLLIHGVTELSAIVIAAAAGFRLGWTAAFPGARTRAHALAQEGRRAAQVMAGVVLMLMVAGLLEGFGRQLITADWARWAVAALSAATWAGYVYGPWTRRPPGARA
ncbi:MAG: stage II sporulation protein M [Caulobacteraceae bacterium]|nr:stage II sporulation protein M [Caulobacter sp.]